MADPAKSPLPSSVPSHDAVLSSSRDLILSASGWRKVFAADGNEESSSETISAEDTVLAGIIALSFAAFIKKKTKKNDPLIVLGLDSRPTGPAIGDSMCRVFLSQGIAVQNLFIVAAPEIMAYSSCTSTIDGFAYISASHNPVGHNGLKFGIGGGVIGGSDSGQLIDSFKELLKKPKSIADAVYSIENVDPEKYGEVLQSSFIWKKEAYKTYLSFEKRIISNSTDPHTQNTFFKTMSTCAAETPAGVIGELNGSARSLSIDRAVLSAGGIKFLSYNDTPGEIVHRIVPEGHSLNDCRSLLETEYKKDNAFILGYVPDNDGDRGNIVYIDKKNKKARILEAQEVFALAVLGELTFLSTNLPTKQKAKYAVAVNGPTSMRIDRIAAAFKAEVFRAEVGEANVVSLAEELREEGYTVRILGEGSNGGNITHPAMVRDPINTLYALLKFLLLKEKKTGNDFFRIWCKKSNQESKYTKDFSLSDVIASLPSFTTTNAFEQDAVMKIKTKDHRILKERYEKIFLKEWKEKEAYLRRHFGIVTWKEINYEGTAAKEGMGSGFRSGTERGGLKIIFMDGNGKETDYIWMRGSGTEPVFRILADCEGKDTEREKWFLHWQRSMIEKADGGKRI